MTYFTRLFFGCIAIAVLSISGCATSPLSESSPARRRIWLEPRERDLTQDGNAGAAVVFGDRGWWQGQAQ